MGKKIDKPYKYMWEMMTYAPWLYLANGVVWAIIHVAPIIPGIIAKLFFDYISGNASIGYGLWGILALLTVQGLALVGFGFLGAWIDMLHRFIMSSYIRRNLLEAFIKKPVASRATNSTGEIINSLRDDASQAENSVSWILDNIGDAVFAVIAIGILLSINARITLFVFTPLVLVLAVSRLVSGRVHKYRKESREATGNVTGAMGEIFSSVQSIKAAGAEEHILNYLDRIGKNRHRLMLKDQLLTQVLESFFRNTINFGTGLILLLVAQSIRDGSFSVGDFAMFVYYLDFISDFIIFFGSFLAFYKQTGVAFQRLTGLIKGQGGEDVVKHNPLYFRGEDMYPEETEENTGESLKTLDIKDITIKHGESGGGIENASFTIRAGEFTVITGRIGSGKSTLIRGLQGLIPWEKGNVSWNGKSVENPESFFTPPHSAYTSQSPNLFSDTVKNNILLGITGEDNLREALHLAVLDEDIKNLDKGLDTVIGPRGMKLSGGQRQRVAAARMLVRKTE